MRRGIYDFPSDCPDDFMSALFQPLLMLLLENHHTRLAFSVDMKYGVLTKATMALLMVMSLQTPVFTPITIEVPGGRWILLTTTI